VKHLADLGRTVDWDDGDRDVCQSRCYVLNRCMRFLFEVRNKECAEVDLVTVKSSRAGQSGQPTSPMILMLISWLIASRFAPCSKFSGFCAHQPCSDRARQETYLDSCIIDHTIDLGRFFDDLVHKRRQGRDVADIDDEIPSCADLFCRLGQIRLGPASNVHFLPALDERAGKCFT
jgi:hypothetical protein